jgi:anti-anti-sigma factor
MRGQAERVEVQKRASGAVRITLTGEIDLSRFDELDGVLASAQRKSPPVLEIDLGSVSFMDSQGLNLLVHAHQRAAENGHCVLIVDPNPTIQRLFRLTGLDGMFEVAFEETTPGPCPCCGSPLQAREVVEDGLRPGDGWCPACRWIVMAEVLAGGDWPVECPTHGRLGSKPPI